jgi:hypothetical protein
MSYIGAKPAEGRSGIWLPEAVRRRRVAGKWTDFIPVAATGGTVTDITVGGVPYRVHTFTTVGNSTFTVTAGGDVEVELLGGGGGGGSGNMSLAGGGGGGGYLFARINVSSSSQAVTVGAKGLGRTVCGDNAARGTTGGTSSFLTLQAIGGVGGLGSGAGGSGGGVVSTGALQVLASSSGQNGNVNEGIGAGGDNGKRNGNSSWTDWDAGAAGVPNITPGNHATGYGNGGGGGHSCQGGHRGGGDGSSGIVIIRYALTD